MKNALLLKQVIYNTIIYLIHTCILYIHVHASSVCIHTYTCTCTMNVHAPEAAHFFVKVMGVLCWVCCVALSCCLFDLACFFLPSFFISLSCTTYTIHVNKTRCYLEDAVEVV